MNELPQPQKSIYLRGKRNRQIWAAAQERWGASMSSLILSLLERYLEEDESADEDLRKLLMRAGSLSRYHRAPAE